MIVAFSISNFSAKDSESSLLAIGTVDDIAITSSGSLPSPIGMKTNDSEWQAKTFLYDSNNWKIEGSGDFRSWNQLDLDFESVNFFQYLQNPTNKGIQFYRISH